MAFSSMSEHRAAAKAEEVQEERGSREGDRQTDKDIHQFAHARAALGKGDAHATTDNGNHAEGLCDRAANTIQDLVQPVFPRHAGTACIGGCRH
ncbi:hypothetical protein XACS582_14340003 [Xanthomonas citri pv. citri]|nr:hypothetical protein XAC902_1710030 [Xanthomonas citri pv. citri]CEE28279.1 hypothetical protein XAC2911_1450025 [Xanthomonas citri pv. citri]CEF22827.1 hypothetical protein XACJK2_2190024 [Xanthomonas citri pv. citri]CEH60689.1 hypothetical protein XACS582_14340003 [Xanthomonas citri pv. citri]CEH61696.1 hypothetical protein XACJK48_9720009 [Xanthomonas citri pv. citri]